MTIHLRADRSLIRSDVRSTRHVAVALRALLSTSDDERDLLRAMVIATFLFVAFNKMIHLNYQFAVVPLACVVNV